MRAFVRMIIVAFFLLGLADLAQGAQEHIEICGSGDSQELLRRLANAFTQKHPEAQISIPESIGSSAGIRATALGNCDLGRVARPIRDKEKGYELQYEVFAYTPVVFFCNPTGMTVDNLTIPQILTIFSGNITSWAEVGVSPQKIYIANREKGDSSRTVLENGIPGFKAIDNSPGEVIYSTPETIEVVKKYPGTISYGPLSMVQGTGLVVLKIAGTNPSIDNVQQGKYTLTAPLGLVWKGALQGLAERFFRYLRSAEAEKIISSQGALPAAWMPR